MVAVVENVQNCRGLFTLAEAARYARLSPVTLARWIDTGPSRVIPSNLGDEKFIDFLDFVQALAVRNLRLEYGVSLQKIRDAVTRAKADYDLDYPFARQHTCYLYFKDIFIKLEPKENPIQLSGKLHDQFAMKTIVELYMRDISFDTVSGLAQSYSPFQWNDLRIVMNPKHRFGEPYVDACGYSAQVLWEAAKIEGSFEAAAESYGVDSKFVEIAYRYFDFLEGRAAA